MLGPLSGPTALGLLVAATLGSLASCGGRLDDIPAAQNFGGSVGTAAPPSNQGGVANAQGGVTALPPTNISALSSGGVAPISTAAALGGSSGASSTSNASVGGVSSCSGLVAQPELGPCDILFELEPMLVDPLQVPSPATCTYYIAPPKPDWTIDPMLVNVFYQPRASDMQKLLNVVTLEHCAPNGGWYFDDPTTPSLVLLCPCNCNVLGDDAIWVSVGCHHGTLYD